MPPAPMRAAISYGPKRMPAVNATRGWNALIIRSFAAAAGGRFALCAIKLLMAQPEALHARAADNLRFIREAMTRASAFTAIPGWGGVAMGVTAIVAAAISGPPDSSLRWVLVWFADAAVAAAIGLAAMTVKARRAGTPLSTAAPAYRF